MNKKIMKILAAAALVLSLSILSSCGDASAIVKSTKDDKKVVMTIDDYEIPLEIAEYFMVNCADDISADGTHVEDLNAIDWTVAENSGKLKDRVTYLLAERYAILKLAAEHGITPEDSTIKNQVDIEFMNYVNEYEDESGFHDDLVNMNMNDAVLRFLLTTEICQSQLYYKLIDEEIIPSTDEQLMDEMMNKDGSMIRVKHIFIKKDDDGDNAPEYDLAVSLQKRAASGEDFDALINEHGEDWQMYANPDGSYIVKHQNLIEFEDAAFALSLGEISEVVETNIGYSVILKLEKEEDYVQKHFNELCDVVKFSKLKDLIYDETHKMTIDEKDFFTEYNPLSFN